MRTTRVHARLGMLVVLGLLFMSACAGGSTYPERPVTLLVGFSPGGPNDLTARALAEAVKPLFPQPLEVVNRPGGGSAVATAELVRAKADGYTLCVCYGPALTLSPYINELPYKGPQDIQPIIQGTVAPVFLAVRADAPWKNPAELVRYAQSNPGKVRIGHAGIGTIGHVTYEDLVRKSKTDLTAVPLPGAADAVKALLSGDVAGIQVNPAAVAGQLAAGRVRLLGAYTERRVPAFPDVPTFKEHGYDVVGRSSYYFVAAPKGTAKEITQRLYDTFKKAEQSESFQKFAQDNYFVVDPLGPEEMERLLQEEYEFYRAFSKEVRLK